MVEATPKHRDLQVVRSFCTLETTRDHPYVGPLQQNTQTHNAPTQSYELERDVNWEISHNMHCRAQFGYVELGAKLLEREIFDHRCICSVEILLPDLSYHE